MAANFLKICVICHSESWMVTESVNETLGNALICVDSKPQMGENAVELELCKSD